MALARATVIDSVDPEGAGRMLIGSPSGGDPLWAGVLVPFGAWGPRPVEPGTEVWVGFEHDDPGMPVVLGLVHPPTGRQAATWQREALGDAWDRGHASGMTDTAGGDTRNPYR